MHLNKPLTRPSNVLLNKQKKTQTTKRFMRPYRRTKGWIACQRTTQHKITKLLARYVHRTSTPRGIMYHGQILVPNLAHKQILETLHVQHCGETKILANARQLYFWIGMTDQIKLMTSKCKTCLKLKPSKPVEPLIQTHASRPFEAISIDLGYLEGTHYLILADRYSG